MKPNKWPHRVLFSTPDKTAQWHGELDGVRLSYLCETREDIEELKKLFIIKGKRPEIPYLNMGYTIHIFDITGVKPKKRKELKDEKT